MGRHARTPPPEPDLDATATAAGTPGDAASGTARSRPPAVSPRDMLGWGAFATVVGAVLAGWTGHGWGWALPVLGLGAGATAILWAMTRSTAGRRRAAGPSHRRGARHGARTDADDEVSATHPERGARGA